MFSLYANAWTLVPQPFARSCLVQPQVTLQIVTATSGIVLSSTFVTLMTNCVASDRRWLAGNAELTETLNLPFGSFALCSVPPPHALRVTATATPPKRPQLRILRPLK